MATKTEEVEMALRAVSGWGPCLTPLTITRKVERNTAQVCCLGQQKGLININGRVHCEATRGRNILYANQVRNNSTSTHAIGFC